MLIHVVIPHKCTMRQIMHGKLTLLHCRALCASCPGRKAGPCLLLSASCSRPEVLTASPLSASQDKWLANDCNCVAYYYLKSCHQTAAYFCCCAKRGCLPSVCSRGWQAVIQPCAANRCSMHATCHHLAMSLVQRLICCAKLSFVLQLPKQVDQ